MTKQEFADEMEIIDRHSGAVFVKFRLDHARYLKGDCSAAAVLAFILNKLSLKRRNPVDQKRLRDDDMWFRCPAGEIQEAFGMTHHKQAHAVAVLIEQELLREDHRKGNTLWVRVDCEKLRKLENGFPESGKLDFRKTENGFPESGNLNGVSSKPVIANPTRKNLTKKLNKNPAATRTVGSEAPTLQKEKGIALRLKEGLTQAGKNTSQANLPQWTKEIAKLHKFVVQRNGIIKPYGHIREVLTDHLANLDDPYQPQAWSARSFREDFPRLEAARRRRLTKNQEKERQDEMMW